MCNIIWYMFSGTESELLIYYSHNSATRIIIADVGLAVGHRLVFHSVLILHSYWFWNHSSNKIFH